MKKFFRRSHDGRNDAPSLQPPADLPQPNQQQQQQQQQQSQQQPQHGSVHSISGNTANPTLNQSFSHLSVSPQPQQYQQQQYRQQQQPTYQPPHQQLQSQSQPHQHPQQQYRQSLSQPFQQTQPQQSQPQQSPHSPQQQHQQPQQGQQSYYAPTTATSPSSQLGPSAGQANQQPPAQNNDIARFLVEQADNMIANNDFAGAVTTYTLAIQNNPMDPDLLVKRAYAYRMLEPPKLNEALRDAQTACRANPYDWRMWSQLGQTYLQNKDVHFARDALEKAVEMGGSQVSSVTRSALDNARTLIERGTTSLPQSVPAGQSLPPVQPKSLTQPQTTPIAGPSIQVTQTIASSATPALATSNIPPLASPNLSPQATQTMPVPPRSPNLSPQTAQTMPAPPRSPNISATNVRMTAPTSMIPDLESSNPAFAPPGYAPNTTSTDPAVRGLSQQALNAQLTDFQELLSARLRGAMSAKAYTLEDKLDTVKLVYVGLQQTELTNKELGTPIFAHPAFQRIYASTVDYPGSTYLNFDPETLVIYDGGAPGTLSVSGYAEEYRQQQYIKNPRVTIALEQDTPLPTVTLDLLVKRVHSLQYPSTHVQTDEALKQVLGDSPILTGSNDPPTQIKAICFTLNRRDPERFATYTSTGRNVTSHLFGSKDQGIGVKNWLHQLVLGSELLLRLRAQTQPTTYTGIVTDAISALLFVCDEFMKDVDIRIKPDKTDLDDPGRYTFVAREHVRQSAALIRFAEVLRWPYIDDVRNYCENAFDDIIAGRYVIFDIYDWLYSLFRPGFHFRFQLMSCLRYATPKIRDLGGAPYYESGLVVGNKSYWSRRTVLGKVLGGCKSTTMICGWIGPCIKPTGVDIQPVIKDGQSIDVDGAWVELTARAISCPVPCHGPQDTNYQYQRPDEDESTFLAHLVNIDSWMPASGPTLAGTERYPVKLKTLALANVKGPQKPDATELEKRPSYRATATFDLGTQDVSYTLYSNPFFVYANPCIGEHPLFDRQIARLAKNTFHVSQLKDAYPETNAMIVIDALSYSEDGDEECVARAWCSERGLNAVIRRGRGCCYGCAVTLATQRLGLGFNVLICS